MFHKKYLIHSKMFFLRRIIIIHNYNCFLYMTAVDNYLSRFSRFVFLYLYVLFVLLIFVKTMSTCRKSVGDYFRNRRPFLVSTRTQKVYSANAHIYCWPFRFFPHAFLFWAFCVYLFDSSEYPYFSCRTCEWILINSNRCAYAIRLPIVIEIIIWDPTTVSEESQFILFK